MIELLVVGQPRRGIHLFGRTSSLLDDIRAGLGVWSARRRERAALLSISNAELKELGISRAQALFQYNKMS